jgi:hypothetical protein
MIRRAAIQRTENIESIVPTGAIASYRPSGLLAGYLMSATSVISFMSALTSAAIALRSRGWSSTEKNANHRFIPPSYGIAQERSGR